jgi:NADPH:quinone reductase-like Zn-dependent oxidoreductase
VFVGAEHAGSLTGMGRQLRGALVSPFVGQRLTLFLAKERAADLEVLTELIEAGKLTPCLDRTYPLDQAPEAMRQLEHGQVRGKIAITLDAGPQAQER